MKTNDTLRMVTCLLTYHLIPLGFISVRAEKSLLLEWDFCLNARQSGNAQTRAGEIDYYVMIVEYINTYMDINSNFCFL